MRVGFAYLAMVLIWSTVPLALKWSVVGYGFLFAAGARVSIALICMLPVMLLLQRQGLPLNRPAICTYCVSALNFLAAALLYWGAQFVPSGWLGVTFGTMPFITAVMAAIWLGERSLTPLKLSGLVIGFCGVLIVFITASEVGEDAFFGLLAAVGAVTIAAAVPIAIRRIGAPLSGFEITVGGLGIAMPIYLTVWLVIDGQWPSEISTRATWTLLYIGVVGTAVVFTLFYYTLRHLSVTQVSLIGMVTPILALFIGVVINNEQISPRIWLGTALIIVALVLHEYLPRRKLALKGPRA